MKVNLRKPGLKVTLFKNVTRTMLDGSIPVSTRVSNSNSVDLTPYIGEHNGVRVRKSVREPAGSFSITMTDQLYYDGNKSYGDSLYGLIEPMDSIEIRMTANAYQTAGGGQYPMMMRGFVSRVEISETMGSDGKPQRNIIVSGQDYGKILQMMQIFHQPGVPNSDAAYMSEFPFFAQFGQGVQNSIMPASQFITLLFGNVINPYIAKLNESLDIIMPDVIVSSGQVSPYGTGGWQGGTIHNLIMSVGDIGTWNEFFIEDREDGPYAVYRPNPFYAVDSNKIFTFPDGKWPATNIVGREDVVSISASRTDANLANYFWVTSPRFNLAYEDDLIAISVQASQQVPAGSQNPGPFISNYPNIDPTLYGMRKMMEQTNQGGNGETNQGNGTQLNALRVENKNDLIGWITQKRLDMIAQNKDNIVFENGSMRLAGNENIRAGTYVQYKPGNVANTYYAVSVEHDYAPFGSYFTSVEYERGTGFIGRAQQDAGAQSPYLAEMVDKS